MCKAWIRDLRAYGNVISVRSLSA